MGGTNLTLCPQALALHEVLAAQRQVMECWKRRSQMTEVTGRVYRYGSNERVESAVVKATKEKDVACDKTDSNGDFRLALDVGKWTLVAMDEQSLPSKPKEVEVTDATTTVRIDRIDLFRLQGTEDEVKGRYFWFGLLIGLAVVIAVYIGLHMTFPRQPVPLSATLPTLIAQAQEQATKADKTSESAELLATVADIKTGIGLALAQNATLSSADKQAVTRLAEEIEASVKANGKDEALARLATLDQLVQAPSEAVVGLWDHDPWRFLEVLLWGLAGVLVHKLITIAWYLRTQKFYREGIIMHAAHIITTPLLALVAVLLLSLVTLNVTLASGNQLTLDLSDPRILAAFSFLLGSSPWPLWDFIEDTAKRITGRVEG
jgi:hypothetical protein